MKFIASIIGLVFLTTITNYVFNTLSIDNYQDRKLNDKRFRDGYNHRRLLNDKEGPKGSNPDLLSKSQPSDAHSINFDNNYNLYRRLLADNNEEEEDYSAQHPHMHRENSPSVSSPPQPQQGGHQSWSISSLVSSLMSNLASMNPMSGTENTSPIAPPQDEVNDSPDPKGSDPDLGSMNSMSASPPNPDPDTIAQQESNTNTESTSNSNSDSDTLNAIRSGQLNSRERDRIATRTRTGVEIIRYFQHFHDRRWENDEGQAQDDGLRVLGSVLTAIGTYSGNPFISGILSCSSNILGLIPKRGQSMDDPTLIRLDAIQQQIRDQTEILKSKIDNLGNDIRREAELIRDRTEQLFNNQDFRNQLRELDTQNNLVNTFRNLRSYINDDMTNDFKGDTQGTILYYLQTIDHDTIRKIEQLEKRYEKYEEVHYTNRLFHYQLNLAQALQNDFKTWINQNIDNNQWHNIQKEQYIFNIGQFANGWATLMRELIDSYTMYALAWEACHVLPALVYNTSAQTHNESIGRIKSILENSARNLDNVNRRIERIMMDFRNNFGFVENPSVAQQAMIRGVIYNSNINQDFYYLMAKANLSRNVMDMIKSVGNDLERHSQNGQTISIQSLNGNKPIKTVINDMNSIYIKGMGEYGTNYSEKIFSLSFEEGNIKYGWKMSDKMQIRLMNKNLHIITIQTVTNRFVSYDSDTHRFTADAMNIGSAAKFQIIVNNDRSLSFRLFIKDYRVLTRNPSINDISSKYMEQHMLKQRITDQKHKFKIVNVSANFHQEKIKLLHDKYFILKSKKGNYFMYFDPDPHQIPDPHRKYEKRIRITTKPFGYTENGFQIKQCIQNPNVVRLFKTFYNQFVKVDGGDGTGDNLYFKQEPNLPNQQKFEIRFNRDNSYISLYHKFSNKYVTLHEDDSWHKQIKLKNINDDSRQWELIPIADAMENTYFINKDAYKGKNEFKFILEHRDGYILSWFPDNRGSWGWANDGGDPYIDFKNYWRFREVQHPAQCGRESLFRMDHSEDHSEIHSYPYRGDIKWELDDITHKMEYPYVFTSFKVTGKKGNLERKGWLSCNRGNLIKCGGGQFTNYVWDNHQPEYLEMFIMILQPELYYKTDYNAHKPVLSESKYHDYGEWPWRSVQDDYYSDIMCV